MPWIQETRSWEVTMLLGFNVFSRLQRVQQDHISVYVMLYQQAGYAVCLMASTLWD